MKAKIRVSPEESETKTLDQNLCCYSYISAKCEGATYKSPYYYWQRRSLSLHMSWVCPIPTAVSNPTLLYWVTSYVPPSLPPSVSPSLPPPFPLSTYFLYCKMKDDLFSVILQSNGRRVLIFLDITNPPSIPRSVPPSTLPPNLHPSH